MTDILTQSTPTSLTAAPARALRALGARVKGLFKSRRSSEFDFANSSDHMLNDIGATRSHHERPIVTNGRIW